MEKKNKIKPTNCEYHICYWSSIVFYWAKY